MKTPEAGAFYITGGTLSPDAPSYIERPADKDLYRQLLAGNFCYILTSRQMGKSSLMARTANRLKEQHDARVAIVDLTEIGSGHGEKAVARWYYGIAHRIQRQLGAPSNFKEWWHQRNDLPAVQRLTEFFEEIIGVHSECQVVIFVDEIDSTIGLPFAGDFFAAIRSCYNRRSLDPEFDRLVFVLLGVASPSDLIPDVYRTPFNVGQRIDLGDFTLQEALPLAKGLPGSSEVHLRLSERVQHWTNGHPYLTQRTFAELAIKGGTDLGETSIDDAVSRVFITPPLHQADKNIAYVRRFLTDQREQLDSILALYRVARSGRGGIDDEPLSPVKSALKLSGLFKVDRNGKLVLRNRIYERAFVDWDMEDTRYARVSTSPAKRESTPAQGPVHYTTAKVVLVGDTGVGKSGLAFRLVHGRFENQASTHGQQFWVFPALGQRRADGADCEAILWDFAGQPDYRLVHALFVDNADLALILFDASDLRDPLHGVNFWLNQLQTRQARCPILLVAAQADRGTSSLTPDELKAFCQSHGIAGPITTSAHTGLGIAELVDRMRSLIRWEDKPALVTTTTFKRIQDYILGLKESDGQAIVTPGELRSRLEATDGAWRFSEVEMLTAVGHLENYGYVRRLRTLKGEQRVLLNPERLNNLASSFVLEARRNPKGLGALEEKRLLSGGYDFPELKDLEEGEQKALLDSAAALFLEHHLCFRETDPLRMEPYLVFPELINLKKPMGEPATEDGMAYTVKGATGNVFASLVVGLGYTHTFTRSAQWHNNARYEVGDGRVCGFRMEEEREGELDFVLCFSPIVGLPVRTLFQGLFETFLARRNLTVIRYELVRCTDCGHLQDRSLIRLRLERGSGFIFCNNCGAKLTLPTMAEPIQLTGEVQAEVESQRRIAEKRTRFEQAIFRLRAYMSEQKIKPPTTFISYVWGVPEHERWVEKRLANDLQKAGIEVLLDRWHSAQIGASVARFVERIEKSDRIVIIGTSLYRRKYENRDATGGYVVAAEVDVINNRLLGTEQQKQSVLPVLLEGEQTTSLPTMLQYRVYADFRNESEYFITAFDLILSLYQFAPNDPTVADLRESLRNTEIR